MRSVREFIALAKPIRRKFLGHAGYGSFIHLNTVLESTTAKITGAVQRRRSATIGLISGKLGHDGGPGHHPAHQGEARAAQGSPRRSGCTFRTCRRWRNLGRKGFGQHLCAGGTPAIIDQSTPREGAADPAVARSSPI
jgi:hypothetical protein